MTAPPPPPILAPVTDVILLQAVTVPYQLYSVTAELLASMFDSVARLMLQLASVPP